MARKTKAENSVPKAHAGYTRRVTFIRRAAPLVAVIIVAAVVFWPQEDAPDPFTLSSVEKEIEPEVLRMVNPSYSGMTGQGDAFQVRADVARQARSDPAQIELDAIEANLSSQSLGDVVIRAAGGHFHTVNETLALQGRTVFSSSAGYTLSAGALFVNFGEGNARSHAPVVADMPQGHLTASGFELLDGGDRLRFMGPVRLVVLPVNER